MCGPCRTNVYLCVYVCVSQLLYYKHSPCISVFNPIFFYLRGEIHWVFQETVSKAPSNIGPYDSEVTDFA